MKSGKYGSNQWKIILFNIVCVILILLVICGACVFIVSKYNAHQEAKKEAERERQEELKKEEEQTGAEEQGRQDEMEKEDGQEQQKAEESYAVTVSQYDISDYPVVKAYLDVRDTDGKFVKGLGEEDFCVKENRGGNKSEERTIQNVVQINDNEGISIGLVADVGRSMDNEMSQVKEAMLHFMDAVQFDNGDEVELAGSGGDSFIYASFTNDISQLEEAIDEIETNVAVRLYDTLMSELERIQSRQNAKCIIAFADGRDNKSIHTADEVSDYAKFSGVPVFMIGIGSDCDEESLKQIADATGGSYQNISDISSLEACYREIYQEEKSVYLLEYETKDTDNFDGECQVGISFENGSTGKEAQFSFEPGEFFEVLYNRFLIAGIDCQTKGERNLLDSGLIFTTQEAYSNPDCVAYQSQEAIRSGGTGARSSDVYVVLMDHAVLNVYKSEIGYTLYCVSNYDISKISSYAKSESQERREIEAKYGTISNQAAEFLIEENRNNYEKLTLAKDSDGQWKFYTRVYEREDGGSAYPITDIYNVTQY